MINTFHLVVLNEKQIFSESLFSNPLRATNQEQIKQFFKEEKLKNSHT
jgi:hypothetical protein